MEAKESWERFEQGLKIAASCARQLGIAQKNRDWTKVAFAMESLVSKGQTIYSRRALSRSEVLKMTEDRAKETGDKLNV